jgi:hypothetical protein
MSYHKDVINFGEEEANRMAANAVGRGWEIEAGKWLRTTTGQEFLDELVWDGIGTETLDALLQSFGTVPTPARRTEFLKIADYIICKEGY